MSTTDLEPVRVLLVGVGAIGSTAADECVRSDRFDVVGIVDPLRAGERIGEVEIVSSLSCATGAADVALLCTASTLSAIQPDLEVLVASGLDVVSTCEELTLPWLTDATIAGQLDKHATAAERTILGCGVNPGLMMDVLPLMLSTASLQPRAVNVSRRVDLEQRRLQLRQKLGVGRPAADWHDEQNRVGSFGHFGLVESAHLLALGLDWAAESTEFARQPLVADGIVTGIQEDVRVLVGGGRHIELQLVFELGGDDVDEVLVDADPPLQLRAQGGIHGDRATVARLLSAARVVGGMPAGLRLPIEAPLWNGNAAALLS